MNGMMYQLYGHNLGYRRFWFMSNHQLVLCPLGVLYPPSHYCLNESCTKQKLQKVEQRRAILYTLGEGVCPLWVMTLYCAGNNPIFFLLRIE